MNIQEIKRQLNSRKSNYQDFVSSVPPAQTPVKVQPPPPPPVDKVDKVVINKAFDTAKSDEEKDLPPPNSEVWCAEDHEGDSFHSLEDVHRSILDLGLDDPKYDWREEKPRGKKSRKNFTDFLRYTL